MRFLQVTLYEMHYGPIIFSGFKVLPLKQKRKILNSRGAVIDFELNHIEPDGEEDFATQLHQRIEQMNPQQREVFDQVMDSVNNKRGTMFSLNACGGSGKTYVLNCILDHLTRVHPQKFHIVHGLAARGKLSFWGFALF